MTQSVAQAAEAINLGGTHAPVTRKLNGVAAGNRLEVLCEAWGATTDPALSADDGTAYTKIGSLNTTNPGGRFESSLHYRDNVASGNYTVTVTHAATSGNRYGWVVFREVTGGDGTGADSAVTATSQTNTSTPSITAAGATSQANSYVVAICGVNASVTDVSLDAASGSSLTWTNGALQQNPDAEAAYSADAAPSTSAITPTCAWGTLAGAYNVAMLITAFKDAAGGGGSAEAYVTMPPLAPPVRAWR